MELVKDHGGHLLTQSALLEICWQVVENNQKIQKTNIHNTARKITDEKSMPMYTKEWSWSHFEEICCDQKCWKKWKNW